MQVYFHYSKRRIHKEFKTLSNIRILIMYLDQIESLLESIFKFNFKFEFWFKSLKLDRAALRIWVCLYT